MFSVWRTEALAARSQGKPKIVPKIEGINSLCLSGCSSITELARAMGLALFERAIVPVASHHPLWG